MERNAAYRLTNEERETLIRWSAADKRVIIDSADPVVIRKLDKLCEKYPDAYTCVSVDDVYKAKRYSLTDCHYIKFANPPSEARREACRKNSANSQFKPLDTTSTPLV